MEPKAYQKTPITTRGQGLFLFHTKKQKNMVLSVIILVAAFASIVIQQYYDMQNNRNKAKKLS